MKTNDGRSRHGYLWTMARQRCPNCRKGFVYRNSSERNNLCPACGIRFEREPGYYTGAIYLGVLLAFPVLILFIFLTLLLFPSLDPTVAVIIGAVFLVPTLPLITRVAYIFWMAIDRGVSRDDAGDPPPPDPTPKDPTPAPRPRGGAKEPEEVEEKYEA